MKNLKQQLEQAFPDGAYKDVSLGARTFTTIDAYHIIDRLNTIFGLTGKGWGLCDSIDSGTPKGKPEIKVETCTEIKTMPAGHTKEVSTRTVVAYGILWYTLDGEYYGVVASGDARVIKDNVAEAYKKALTNLVSKASSYLGIGLSVYQGKGHDDPYLDEQADKSKFAQPKQNVFAKK